MVSLSRRWILAFIALSSAPLAAWPQAVTGSFVFKEGRVVDGPGILKLKRGDSVELTVSSDRPEEVHVHGYDLHRLVEADRPAKLSFIAKRTGRFAIELHRAGVEIGAIEVYPR